jgi:hypothetical protein
MPPRSRTSLPGPILLLAVAGACEISPDPAGGAFGIDGGSQGDASAGETGVEDDAGDAGSDSGEGPSPDLGDGDGDGSTEGDGDGDGDGDGAPLDPPAGQSSKGSGGGPVDAELLTTPSGVYYRLIAPAAPGPLPFLLVYSGTEGSQPMSINLLNFRGPTGTSGFVIAVLHGVEYFADPQAGIDVMDEVRAHYDIDNDRTYLMSESAGTTAGLMLAFEQRPSWFAAYWANDVTTSAEPLVHADELGFSPWGNAGPGGQWAHAQAIVDGMAAAGWRTPEPSPYDGAGSGTHGDLDQLVAAIAWFPGKRRQ